jgi:hypothetical protein
MKQLSGQHLLRANAVISAVVGVLLLLAPSHRLYDALDLPIAEPEIFAQLAGVYAIAFSMLLWEAPINARIERLVGRAACFANALAVLVIALWLVSGQIDTDLRGKILLWVIAAPIAFCAVAEARYFQPESSRR